MYDLFNEIDVIKRNSVNLIIKKNNPKEVVPIPGIGECTEIFNYGDCGDPSCISCDEFEPTSLEGFNKYAIKMYKHIYKFKRNEEVLRIEKRLYKSLEDSYKKMSISNDIEFERAMYNLKKLARKELSNEKRE